MKKSKIKVGFCVAYDWKLLQNSIPPVYQEADIICLALDKDNKSWAGNEYDLNREEFESMVHAMDPDNKIDIYYDDFSKPELNARENCNRHRTMLSQKMGMDGGWYIQIDSDEYFTDFSGFVSYLNKINPNPKLTDKPINIQVAQFPLIKKLGNGFLYVEFDKIKPNFGPFATNKPEYLRARVNGHFNNYSPFYVIHETWSRGEEELEFKLKNWGHSAEELKNFNIIDSYLELWKSLDSFNYQFVRNFHFTQPEAWPRLGFAKGKNISEFIKNFDPDYHPNKTLLAIQNTRLYGKLKALLKSSK